MSKLIALLLLSALAVFFLWNTSSVCVGTSLCGAPTAENQRAILPGRPGQNDSAAHSNTTQHTVAASMSNTSNEITGKRSEKVGTTETIPRNKMEETHKINKNAKDNAAKQRERAATDADSAVRTDRREAEPTPGDSHVLFIETKCLLDDTQSPKYLGLSLHKRQVCAIESAAKMNPDNKVYLLYSCPVYGGLDDSSEYVRTLFTYPNVNLWKLDIKRHFSKTPLENWDFEAAIKSSRWPKEHSSDVLRFLTLWKYGGTYLDLDFIILKSLAALGTNYVGLESQESAGSCVLSFAWDGIGHAVADSCVEELRTNFRGDIWVHNGPGLITRVLLKTCNCSRVAELSTERCRGFQVLSAREFFPIPFHMWHLFFNESTSEHTMDILKDSFGVHLWNNLSKNTTVNVGSQQPYSVMAATACPRMYAACGGYF